MLSSLNIDCLFLGNFSLSWSNIPSLATTVLAFEVAKGDLVTEAIRGRANFSWVGKKLADKSGNVLKFATYQLAKWHGNKQGGKASAEDNYFIVIKY